MGEFLFFDKSVTWNSPRPSVFEWHDLLLSVMGLDLSIDKYMPWLVLTGDGCLSITVIGFHKNSLNSRSFY